MARHPTCRFLPAAGLLALLFAAGCNARPTYPKAHLAESLQALLTSEGLKTSVRTIDHTLAVQVDQPGILSQQGTQIGIGPAFEETIRTVIIAIHRVLLSTDAEARFYVLLVADPQIPGAYLTLVRYLDDVRRANANMLDTPEIFARTIFDLNYIGASAPVTIEQYVPRDIRLEEFLSWQLSRRIQHTLMDEFQAGGAVQIGRCGGAFQNGEFSFTLNLLPIGPGPLDEAMMQRAFETSTTLIARVLSSYQFHGFERVRLIHPPSGRNLVLPKTNLEIFR